MSDRQTQSQPSGCFGIDLLQSLSPDCVFNGGAQIAVGKEVAGHSDLIGRKNSPEGSRRIPCIVRGNAKAKAARRVLAEDVADCGVGESAALRVQPKRGAGRVRPPDRS